MIDVHYASLTSQGVHHRVFYLDGHPSRYQPRPTGLNFGEQTGTGVFPLVIAVPLSSLLTTLSWLFCLVEYFTGKYFLTHSVKSYLVVQKHVLSVGIPARPFSSSLFAAPNFHIDISGQVR